MEPTRRLEEYHSEPRIRKCKRLRTTEATPRQTCRPIALLDDIPPGILEHILRHLDIASLVQAAGSCSTLRRLVFQENWPDSLWSRIDFGTVDARFAAQITDPQLAALLRNCRARVQCQVLKLSRCTSLTGTGLEPLRGSRVLREIDLWLDKSVRVGRVEVDLDFVLPLLSSMPPMATNGIPSDAEEEENDAPLGLSRVIMRRQFNGENFFGLFDERVADWFVEFEEALRAHFRDTRVQCGYCVRTFADACSWEDLWWKAPTAYCQICGRLSCATGNECPVNMQCRRCQIQSCQGDNCEHILNCNGCDVPFCLECVDENDVKCENYEDCGRNFCGNCSHLCRLCSKCKEAAFCHECIEAHENDCCAVSDSGESN